jgi:hypothetical protein
MQTQSLEFGKVSLCHGFSIAKVVITCIVDGLPASSLLKAGQVAFLISFKAIILLWPIL